MKWIGQNIYDLISRFRNDVYLEDISSGTIASGGNLGLDSNNKIVKAAEVGSAVDLTSEVTGVLPSANMDADTAHLTTNQTFSGVKTFSDVLILDGNRNWGGEAGLLHLDSSTITDTTTSASATSAEYRTVNIEHMTLAATNANVTYTDAASLKIMGAPVAGTNMTITNQWALWVDSGNVRLDSGLKLDDVLLSGVQTSSESFADNDTSLMTSAAIDDRIRVVSKHVLRCNSFYANGDWVQNSLFIGNSVGNNPWNWNDQAAVGGAISTTSSFTIINDDENWGIVLPMDISKIEVQCSVRISGTPGAIDFSLAVYTGVRSSDSNSDLTLTKIAHQSVSFNSGNQRYKQNDLTYTGNLDKGTMIYVGVGTEDAPNNAKNGRGYMNITVTER